MAIKKNLGETVSRLSDFYGGKAEDRIFAKIGIRGRDSSFNRRVKSRLQLATREGLPDIKTLFSVWEEYLSPLYNLEDDDVPTIYLSQYDQGLYGAILGAEITVNRKLPSPQSPYTAGWFSSMTRPLEHFEPDEWEWDEDNSWIRRFEDDLMYVADRGRDRFGISVIITIDALNFIVQILGSTKGLVCMYRHPRIAKRLMEFALHLNVKLVELQRRIIDVSYKGGVFERWGGWVPNESVPMSVDCYNFCRPWIYAERGRSYHQRLIDHFGGGVFHVHGNGRHLLPEMAKLRGIKAIFCWDDGSPNRAFETLAEMKRKVEGIPLVVGCTKREFLQGLKDESLEGGVMYHLEAESLSEGNLIMDRVKRYRI